MLHESNHQTESVDPKTAEEALALAIRLQQQQGERVTIDQLQKTADEAGIDPHYLEEALQRVQADKETHAVEAVADHRRMLMILAMVMGMAMAMCAVILMQHGAMNGTHAVPMFPAFVAAIVAVTIVRRHRRR
jgi:uncharacterized membrane protein YeaQ/YmgE (transglycosylase-associated protein family)